MQIVHAKDAKRIEQGTVFVAHEYATSAADINTARIELRSRYPETGTMRNTQVKEIAYVEAGVGTVTINGVPNNIAKGDVILYEKGEEVFWEGELTLIISCTPAWSADQFEFLP